MWDMNAARTFHFAAIVSVNLSNCKGLESKFQDPG